MIMSGQLLNLLGFSCSVPHTKIVGKVLSMAAVTVSYSLQLQQLLCQLYMYRTVQSTPHTAHV
jgi:hypothetical protein